MKSLFWVSFSHREKEDYKLIKEWSENINCYVINNLRKKNISKRNIINKLLLRILRLDNILNLFKISYYGFFKSIIREIRDTEFSVNPNKYWLFYFFERLFFLIYRILWVESYSDIMNKVFIFRGVNDPLITYLKYRFKEKSSIFIIPHGTDFILPKHNHWRSADYWVTNYLEFRIGTINPKILYLGRLEYSYMNHKKINSKKLSFSESKVISLIFPKSSKNLIDYYLEIIKSFVKSTDYKIDLKIRPHPGDIQLSEYVKTLGYAGELELQRFIDKSDILLFPVGRLNWVSNVYYESTFSGKISGILIKKADLINKRIVNLNYELDHNLIEANGKSLKDWVKNIEINGYSNLPLVNSFVSSKDVEKRILKYITSQ
ncbi:hypothetical protein HA150_07165 [Prochlorococcus marinus XMU1414]|uniref:Uncharacterized protein n=1 Tax=Prochlorococcus marinus XMU1424 TaxID=2774497 RepID=A0A9D9BVX2_PROMR|nr:hypothetical protein [Prochlorococcus marinus]MBO8228678.1 hypothetical protein [Prochlorococcus marinus XMU1414]MBW3046157.1 hypothetical protein [Prochlorococcus marinus str. MU1414]MCR8531551.1 hypothetical protein [Prochlorococcus marinus XMU1420]MCR8535280.1 hypothetical protein [Prochlorococcus marinus XMU1424]